MMASLEKLIRAFEALKVVQLPSSVSDEAVLRRREKTTHCITIADAMCNANMKSTQEFSQLLSISIETLLQLCNDQDSDVRMVADESLNRIIRALMDNNIGKILLELHKEIKKNGNARTLRAALWRFAELCHMIRPQKGKPYIQSLVPYIEKIVKRQEEAVLETLATAVDHIFQALGIFSTDSEVKVLLRAFFQKLSSSSAVARRASAASIVSICIHCKKPQTFISWSLSTVLESLLPIRDDFDNTSFILGALGVIRSLIPHLNAPLSCHKQETETMRGSFGKRKTRETGLDESVASIDNLIQIYELALHFALHEDHNVANAALECLQQLLRSPSPELLSVLLSPSGIGRSYILATDEQSMAYFKHRTLSQISVSQSIVSDDVSVLLDETITEANRTKPRLQVVGGSQTSFNSGSLLNMSLPAPVTSGTDSLQCSEDLLDEPFCMFTPIDTSDAQLEPEPEEIEQQWPQLEDEDPDSPCSPHQNTQCDVGSFCDTDVPLVYCTRLIAYKFLLNGKTGGLRRDSEVRISVKALALGCLSAVISLWPEAFVLHLDKQERGNQVVSDVLKFTSHPDPQLRGCISMLAGSLIKTVLLLNGNTFTNWGNKHDLTISHILDPVHQGLKGNSSVSCLQTLTTMQDFLNYLLKSQDSLYAIPLLSEAVSLHSNPYWLVKVRLVELLASLEYISIAHASNSCALQHQVLHTVLMPLLADDDSRVRHAAVLGIVKIIPHLFFQTDELCQDPVTVKALKLSNKFLTSAVLVQKGHCQSSNETFNLIQPIVNDRQITSTIEGTLSRVVHILSNALLTSTTKFLLFGCCEALAELSMVYSAVSYPRAWNCIYAPKSLKKSSQKQVSSQGDFKPGEETSPACGLLATVTALMTSSSVTLDLSCQQWLLQLAGNLFLGAAYCCLQEDSFPAYLEEPTIHPKPAWSLLKDRKLAELAEQILKHAVRVLAMFSHILDETVPVVINPKPVLPQSLPSIPSPIKRKSKVSTSGAGDSSSDKASDRDDKSDDKKGNNRNPVFGYFLNIPQCLRIYELLKNAYTNYKITLDTQASEKFLALLHATLNVMSHILEIATLPEIGRSAEELLGYLKITASVEPVATITCVQQLLKSLFGTNYGAQKEVVDNKKKIVQSSSLPLNKSGGFYENCYQIPYRELSIIFEERRKAACKLLTENVNTAWPEQQVGKSPLFKKKDHAALASYIKLFEPMVIKALEQYTVTSDVQLQCKVLQLLSQLVQLRVNYCLLDSDKIFIGFVLKQFELIEEGQILFTEQLIPQIFYFLVHLSYEKNHSKAIIGIPEVIQLCDGLMASGQPPVTHCIPALVPVVEDVFLVRGSATNTNTDPELDTQREVLVAVLLRLAEYHQVLEMLAMVIRQNYLDKERWLRWSRKVVDTLLPLLAQRQVRLESRAAQASLVSLLDSLAPSATELIDPMLGILFSEPPIEDLTYDVQIQRWLGAVLGILSHLLVHSTEEEVLGRISDLCLQVHQHTSLEHDPLNVSIPHCTLPPNITFTRMIFQVIEITVSHVCKTVLSPIASFYEAEYLTEQLSHFLLYCIHMLESGSYCKVAAATIDLVQNHNSGMDQLHIENINEKFLQLTPFCPLLTFLWCYMLVLMGHSDHKFWSDALNIGHKGTLYSDAKSITNATPTTSSNSVCCNLEIVRRGAVILFSDFVCDNLGHTEHLTWLLMNHIEDIVLLSKEIPVQELIAAIHRSPSASETLIQCITLKCENIKKPSMWSLLLQQCLDGIHPGQSGALLQLLASRYFDMPQLTLSRQARALASKRAEMLLMSSVTEVEMQLSKEDLQKLLLQIGNRYEGLRNLLRKIGTEFYNLPPDSSNKGFSPMEVKCTVVDEAWFFKEIKNISGNLEANGPNVAHMLGESKHVDILSIMCSPQFNLATLAECIKHGRNLSIPNRRSESVSRVSPLFEASQTTLLHRIKQIDNSLPRPHQVFQPVGRPISIQEQDFNQRLTVLFTDLNIINTLIQLAEAVPIYFTSLPRLNLDDHLSKENQELFAKFGVLCLEVAYWQIGYTEALYNPGNLESTLACATSILSDPNVAQQLGVPEMYVWLASACNATFAVTKSLLKDEAMPQPYQAPGLSLVDAETENYCIIQACPQISIMISWIEKSQHNTNSVSQYLYKPLKKVIVGLARLPPLNSYAATPPEVWHQGWDVTLGGPSGTIVPPLPLEMLLETEVLEQFIFRLTLLGWTSRQQFEENWMAFLGVLNSSHDGEHTPSDDEATAVLQANGLAVKGITALLVQSLLLPTPGYPNASYVIHQPRELAQPVKSEAETQMKAIHNMLVQQIDDSLMTNICSWQFKDVFHRSNLERIGLDSLYGYSQLSLQYLLSVTKASEDPNISKPAQYMKREECLIMNGLDVHSCLHFLLDLYTQWTQSQVQTPIRLLLEAVRSVLMISDIFTERSQFHWMLHTFIELSKNHPSEDELLHQFLTLGVCKASAVLSQDDADTLEKVRKITDSSLRSGFLPSRICGLHGILHLLQSSRCSSFTPSQDTLQLAIEYIQRHMDLASGSSNHSERHLLALWALVFFLLEDEQVTGSEMAPAVLQLALALVSAGSQMICLNSALTQGLERLVLCGTVRGHVRDQVTKLALDRLKHPNPMNFLSALQLLLTCMYTGKLKSEENNEEDKDSMDTTDPEILLQSLEKTSALFDRIKKGYPHEVELICGVLPTLLSDFFPPSEMLTKVIGEFLSSQQPHPKLLVGVVSQLFERACSQDQLLLIQDWVVLSLSNFTQCTPVGMAVWCLTCFFISASTNYWLRAIFPHIQSRIGRCELEDRELLCIAAADFYQKLSDAQKQDFMAAFKVAAEPHSPFFDILSSCV